MIEELLKMLSPEQVKEMLTALTGKDPTPLISVEALSSNNIRLCNMPAEPTMNPGGELPHLFAACCESLMRANVVSFCDRIVITVQLPGSEPVDLESDMFHQFKTGVKVEDLPLATAEIRRQREEAARGKS